MASYIVTGIHAAARAGKYGKVREARLFDKFLSSGSPVSSAVGLCFVFAAQQ